MRKSFVALAFLLGAATLAVNPGIAQEFRPADDEPVKMLRPREPAAASRASRLSTAATGDTFFIGHVTSGGQSPWHVGRGAYRPGVSREGVWDFEWSANGPDSLQGWVPVVRPNARTLGTIADDQRPWMALDYGNRMNAAPIQGHTYGIVSAWHVDRGKDVPDAANSAATPKWSPLAGTASAWCGLRSADDRSCLDDATRGGTGNPINGDALVGRPFDGSSLTNANFPGYANQWDQMLYRDVRVASGAGLTVSLKYQTYLDVGLDNTTSGCTGWFDKDPLSVTSGNFISSSAAGGTQPVDSFMVYVGVPARPDSTVYSDGQSRSIFDLKRRWFSEVIAIEKPYKEVLSTSGQDSAYKSSARVLTVANAVLQPMLAAQHAADGGGVIRVVFRVKTNKDYADETGTGGTVRSYGYGAVRIDDASITGAASPVSSGFETPAEIDNTIEGPNSLAPGPAVTGGYALGSWKATGKPPKMVFHTHPVAGGNIGPGNYYNDLRYEDLCGPPGSPLRFCNLDGVVVSMGDHDNGERAGSNDYLAFHETRQGMLSPTINLVTPASGVNSCGLDAAHVNTTDDWILYYDLLANIFNYTVSGNVWQWGIQSYPTAQANGSKVWGPICLSSPTYDPYSQCFTDHEFLKLDALIRTSNENGIPDSIRIYLGREQRCISWGITSGCSPIGGAAYDNVSLAFPPSLAGAADKVSVDIWDWFNDTFPANEEANWWASAFDTCAAHVMTGRNTAMNAGDLIPRFNVPGDSIVISTVNPGAALTSVDMVFRILPGPGNYVVAGNRASGLRKVPSSAVPAVSGDNSFWGQYLANNGAFGSPGGHGGAWNPDVWNSARCDTAEMNFFPVSGRGNLSGLGTDRWASMYHESDPKYATLGILKNRCFLVDTNGVLTSSNITCNSVPAWLNAGPSRVRAGYDGQQQTREFTKIIPDGLLTAGSHVEYFFRMSHTPAPAQFVMVPDTNFIYPQPNEGPNYDGHRWQQFGVLPDRWKDLAYGGPGKACLLVLDYNDRRGDERAFVGLADSLHMTSVEKWGAHNGWHCDDQYIAPDGTHDYTGQDVGGHGQYAATSPMGVGNIAIWKHGGNPGTTWDLYQVKAAESGTGITGGIGGRLANRVDMGLMTGKESRQGPTPYMLQWNYSLILLLSGDLKANILGPSWDNSSDDVGILEKFLKNMGFGHQFGLWVMGDGFVESEATSGDGGHLQFLEDYLATYLRDPSYRVLSGTSVLDPNLTYVAERHPGYPGYNDIRVVGIRNSCWSSYNVLGPNLSVIGSQTAGWYENFDDHYAASVYCPGDILYGERGFFTQVDAFDLLNLRSAGGDNTMGRLYYFQDLLRRIFMGAVGYCPIAPALLLDVPQNAAPLVDFAGNVWGNPMRAGGQASMHFGLAGRDHVQVRVYDIAGRLVRTLADRDFAAGEHTLVWDGTDDRGRDLGRGVYFTRVEFLGRRFQDSKKVILLR